MKVFIVLENSSDHFGYSYVILKEVFCSKEKAEACIQKYYKENYYDQIEQESLTELRWIIEERDVQ